MNKKLLIIGLVLVEVALIAAAIFRILTPPQVEIPKSIFNTSNFDNSSTTFSEVRFVGTALQPPATLDVARVTQTLSHEIIINQLTTKFNLLEQASPQALWKNDAGYSLRHNSYNNLYRFFYPTNSTTPTATSLNEEQLQTAAREILSETLGIDTSSLIVQIEKIEYLERAAETYDTVPFEKADQAVIPFIYALDGLPIQFDKLVDPTFDVGIRKDGKPQFVFFYPQFISFETISEKNTISVSNAVENLNKNIGSIIYFRYQDESKIGALDLSTAKNVVLKSVILEYRVDPQNNLIYPFYSFSGTGTDNNNNQLELVVITPAVATTTP